MEYDLKWEIENPTLSRMDTERKRLNDAVCSFEQQILGNPDPYVSSDTVKEIDDRTKKIYSLASRLDLDDLNSFDRAVCGDAVFNAKRVELYSNYFMNPGTGMTIGKFLSGFYAPGTFDKLVNAVRPENLDSELLRAEEISRTKMYVRTPEPSVVCGGFSDWSAEYKTKLLESLKESKAAVDDYYKKINVKPFDYGVDFSPADEPYSYWEDGSFMAILDSKRFYFDGDKYKTAIPKIILAHELGHGLHYEKSGNFPEGLNPHLEGFTCMVHGAGIEGVALAMEEGFLDDINRFGNLSPEDKESLRLHKQSYLPKKAVQIAHDLLEMRYFDQTQNKDFPDSLTVDAHKKLAEITGIKFFADDGSIEHQSFPDTLQKINYAVGKEDIDNLVGRLKREKIPDDFIFNSLLQGVWASPTAHEDFIFNSYIPRVLSGS